MRGTISYQLWFKRISTMTKCPRSCQRLLRIFLFTSLLIIFLFCSRFLLGKVSYLLPRVGHILKVYQPNPGLSRRSFRILPHSVKKETFDYKGKYNLEKSQRATSKMPSPKRAETVLNTTSDENLKWNLTKEEYYAPRSFVVNPHHFRFLKNGSGICNKTKLTLIILVFSMPSRQNHRNAIRKTWAGAVRNGTWMGSSVIGDVKIAFIFGKCQYESEQKIIDYEEKRFNDIIQEDVLEAYKNLTAKSVACLFWVSTFCKAASYYLKTDDDVFVHVPRLVKFVHSLPKEETIYGRINRGQSPVRLKSKWQVIEREFPFKMYPVYTSGGGYVMPVVVAQALFNQSLYLPYIPIEDIYVTGILRRSLGYKIRPMHCKIERRTRNHSAKCDVAKDPHLTLLHACGPETMLAVWKELQQNGTNCPENIFLYEKGKLISE